MSVTVVKSTQGFTTANIDIERTTKCRCNEVHATKLVEVAALQSAFARHTTILGFFVLIFDQKPCKTCGEKLRLQP